MGQKRGFILGVTLLSLILSIVSVSGALDVSKTQQSVSVSREILYDYFEFVLQWPPSLCSNIPVECAISYEKRFIIRSFTPLSYWGSFACYDTPFNITKIEDIRPKLSKSWYDLVYGNDENLWKQVWEKDGVCSADQFDEKEYFEAALKIKNNFTYSVLDILQAAGISPRESNPLWPRYRFYNAIFEKLRKRPILWCNTNKYTNKPQLVMVVLCFARDGITLINCSSHAGNCPPNFTWPTNADPPSPPSILDA